jgi:hypothetical protein
MKRSIALALILAGSAAAQQYTKDGEFVLPKDYREWIFLSSGIAMNYSNTPTTNPVFDNVFVNPAAFRSFLKTGTWPDKTVLLLENRSAGSHASNKEGKFQTGVVGLEAHVKDASRGGWMFYGIKEATGIGKPFAKTASCYTCHEKNAATDTTFAQFYPTLIEAAKKAGTFRDSGDVQ